LGYFGPSLWTKRGVFVEKSNVGFKGFGLKRKHGRVLGFFQENKRRRSSKCPNPKITIERT